MRGPVVVETGPHGAGLGIGPDIFVDRLILDRVGPGAPVAVEMLQVGPLAPGGQRLRHVGDPMKAVMPAVMREGIGAVARDRHIQQHQLAHPLRLGGGIGKGDRAAPVMSGQKDLVVSEMLVDQFADVAGDGFLVITLGRARGIAKPAHVRGDHQIMLGQHRDNFAPHIPGLRPAMQQHQRRAGAGGNVMQGGIA